MSEDKYVIKLHKQNEYGREAYRPVNELSYLLLAMIPPRHKTEPPPKSFSKRHLEIMKCFDIPIKIAL